MRGSYTVSLASESEDLFLRLNELLLQTLNLHLVVLVFQEFELLVVVDQVIDLASVDLVHRNSHCEVPLVVLEVAHPSVKQVFYRQFL